MRSNIIHMTSMSALRQKFADTVGRVERLRAVQRESLRQAEHLFQSLLQEAFTTR